MVEIWLVTQDRRLRGLVEAGVARPGRRVVAFDYLEEILRAEPSTLPAVLVVDISRAQRSQDFACAPAQWPAAWARIPRIVLNDGHDPKQRYVCLSCGAAGYLQKPVSAEQLSARVDDVAMRPGFWPPPCAGGPLRAGPITLDMARSSVTVGSRTARLSRSHALVLAYFLGRPNQEIGHARLLVEALGYPHLDADPRIARVQIWNLRRKIEADPANPALLVNGPGGGYVLAVRGEPALAPGETSGSTLGSLARPCTVASRSRTARGQQAASGGPGPAVTGLDLVELQHRDLISRFRRLEVALATDKGRREVAKLFDFLGSYVIDHFRTEEQVMAWHAYPRYAYHKRLHRRFRADFDEARRQILTEGVTDEVTFAIHRRLRDWIARHIDEEDEDFSDFLADTVVG